MQKAVIELFHEGGRHPRHLPDLFLERLLRSNLCRTHRYCRASPCHQERNSPISVRQSRALRNASLGIPVGCIVCRPGIIQICEKNIIHNHDQSAPVRLTDPPGKIYNLFFFQNRPPLSCLIAPTAESAVPLCCGIICLCQNRNCRLIEHILMYSSSSLPPCQRP